MIRYVFLISSFAARFSTSLFVFIVVLLFWKYFVIQKFFYTAWYYMITSSFQVLNKFTSFGSWVIYGLPLFWCSWQIIVMLFCFEAALFICSKNVWDFSRGISTFVKSSGLWLKLKFLFSAFYYLCWFYY